jgi:hypothetical protein
MSLTIRWPIRPSLLKVDRDGIVGAYLSVLSALTGATPGEGVCVRTGEDRGERVGYYAAQEWWEAPAGGAALCWDLDPIMASMGVSGEYISVSARGLPQGVSLSGRALSSARRPGYATLALEGMEAGPLEALFRDAFGPYGHPTPAIRAEVALQRVRIELAWCLLSPEELQIELEELAALRRGGCAEATAALMEARERLAGASWPRDHYPAAVEWIASVLD